MSDRLCPLSALLAVPRADDAVVARTQGGTRTWRSFRSEVECWAAALLRRPETRWALYCDDTWDAAVRLIGAWSAGKTVVLPGDVLPATRARVSSTVAGWLDEPGPIGDAQSDTADRPLAAPGTALEIFTSGSTGEPLAISKSIAQLDAELRVIEACWGEAIGACGVAGTVPHQHLYGLLFRLLWPLASGRPFDAVRCVYPEDVAAALGEREVALVSSPAFLKRWPDALALHALPRRPRAVFSSGGPLPTDAAQALDEVLGVGVIEVYGSSETGGIAWRVQRGADTPWTLHRGLALRADDDGAQLRSPFLPDPEGWFPLADRVAFCEGGFRLQGRADRIAKIEEKRVSLDAIEAALRAFPEVADARVCPLPAGRLGAVLVLSDAGRASLPRLGRAALHAALRQGLAMQVEAVAVPRRWRHLDRMPVNALGKTPQSLLLALFEDSDEHPPVRALQIDDLKATIEFEVPAGLVAFDGHFPDTPILPGVVQLDWAIAWAQRCFGLAPEFRGVDALKFQKPVRPDSTLTLFLENLPARSAVSFRFLDGDAPCSSGRLVFGGAA